MAELAPPRVLFFGDSLVAGVGDPAGAGWVGRIVSACYAAQRPVTAYNLGVRRETSIDVAARWRAEAGVRIPSDAEARIVVSFGANDTTVEDGEVRVPANDSCAALGQILGQAASAGYGSLVVGPAPVDDAAQNRRIRDLSDAFAGLCEARRTPFVEVVDTLLESPVWMSEVSERDGAHPAAGGYDEIARALAERGLLDWLTR